MALGLAIPARAQITGFGGTGANWTLNSDPRSQAVPSIANNVLLLGNTQNDATSAFYATGQYIGSFTASFVWQNASASDQAGFVFAMQNEGSNAVGEVGADYLGYVGMSLATGIAFNINGIQSGLGYAPTQVPGGGSGGYIATGAVNFAATNPISVNITYFNNLLGISVTDTITGSNFSTNLPENLTAAVGGSTAFVGFTGGGTALLNVSVQNFVFTPAAQPVEPTSFPVVLSLGTNIDVTKLPGNESDGVIAYNPKNPAQLFIAANTNVETGLFGAYCSNVIAGTNITNITVTNLTPISLANIPPGAYPALAWDGYGNLFLAYQDGAFSGIDIAVSTNAGVSFGRLTNLATGHFAVEPRIAVGAGAALGSVWVLYKDFSLAYAPLVAQGAVVTNLGTNAVGAFGLGEIVPGSTNDCGFGDIAVGPQGQVMVAYQNLFDSSGTANCYVSVDADGLGPGAFAGAVVAAGNAVGGNTLIPAAPDGQGINAAVGLAWDLNPASQQYGRVYLICVGQGGGDANNTAIFLNSSTDSGAAWTAQQQVNDDAGQNSHFLPRVAVDPTSGSVAMSWYDCRDSAGNTAAEIYAAVSLNGGLTFQPNVKVSSDSTNGYLAPLADSPTDFGDYTGLTFYGGTFYPVWADNIGEAPNPNNPSNSLDVIMAPVTLTGLADVSIASVLVNPTNYLKTATNLFQIGSLMDYLLTASNNGPSAVSAAYVTNVFPTNVQVIIAFPTNSNNVPIRGNYALHGNTLIWPVGILPVGKSATILVETTAVGIGSATNFATITPGTGVTDVLTNNNATNLVSTIYGADLFLTITNSPSEIGFGAPAVVYTVTVTNEGPVSATGVIISNVLSTNLVLAGVSLPAGDTYTTNLSENSVTFNIGAMTNGQAVTVSMTNYAPTNLASTFPASAICSSIVLGVIDPTITNNSAQSVVPIVPPDMAIGMTGAPAFMAVQDSVTYTLNVTNLGPVSAFAVAITDALPPLLQFVSASVPGGTYTNFPDPAIPGQTDIIASLASPLTNGQSVSLTITATALSLGQATNVAAVGDLVADLNPANNTAQVVTPVLPPDMAIGMTGSPAYIAVGNTVTYTLSVSNLGPVIARGVFISNALPPGLQFASLSARKGTYTNYPDPAIPGQTDIIATLDDPLLAGQSTEVIITATAVSLGQATNVAVVYDSQIDPNMANNTALVVTPVLAPEMVIGMTGSPALIAVGDSVTYSITITNYGPVTAYNVVVTNGLPANLLFSAATVPGGAYTTGPDPLVPGQTDVVASFGTMAMGQTATMTITATAQSLGQATNVAVVYDSQLDPNLVNNTAQVVTAVLAPNLALGMTGAPSFITVGQQVVYLMTVTNLGPVTARSVVISNTLPANLAFASALATRGTYTHSQNEVVFQIGTLTNGQIAVATLTATALSLGLATNVAVVSDSQVDTNLANTTAQVVTSVVAPDIALGMTGSPATVCVGQNILYTLMVTNLGPVPASAVALTNTLPAVLSFEGISVPLGMTYVTNQNEVIFNIGSMTNGQTAAMSIIATAISTGSSGEATNSAVAGDSLDDSAFGNGSASAVTTITNAPPPFSNLTVVPGVTSAFITWNTPSNSTSQVDYGLTAGTSNYSWLNPVLTNYHVVLLTGLVPDTNYYFQAISIVPAVPASDTTNNSIIAVSAGLPSVTYSTNGTFSTPSTLFQQTTDASYSGTGWFAGGATPGIYSYNGDYVYDYVQGVGGYPTSSATFAPNIVVPGLYDVSVWYPSKPGYFTSNAPMYATGATNVVLVYVNQTINGGSWQPLTTGLFLTNGTAGNLTIYNDSGDTSTSVVANGVRWAYELAQDTPASGAVPAWWAEFYFGTNVSGTNVVNGNRYSNYAEYVLGTDPTSPSSQLQFMVAPGPSTNVTVSFAPFQGGRSYQLLSSTNLRNGAWVTLTNTPSQNTNDGSGFFTVGHAPGSPAYYKLSVSLSTTQ